MAKSLLDQIKEAKNNVAKFLKSKPVTNVVAEGKKINPLMAVTMPMQAATKFGASKPVRDLVYNKVVVPAGQMASSNPKFAQSPVGNLLKGDIKGAAKAVPQTIKDANARHKKFIDGIGSKNEKEQKAAIALGMSAAINSIGGPTGTVKTKVNKNFEPAAQYLKGKLASKDVYLVDEFLTWVRQHGGGKSEKSMKMIDPNTLKTVVAMSDNVFPREFMEKASNKKLADAWDYVFKRLSDSKRAAMGLSTSDVGENFAKKGEGLLESQGKLPAMPGQLDMPPQTGTAILGEAAPNRPMNANVVPNSSSSTIVPQDVNFPRKPQELNVNRLELDPTQKAHVASLEGAEIRQKLGDKEIMKIAKDAGLDTKTYTIDQTAQKVAEQLNVRRNIVTLEKQLSTTTDPLAREQIINKIAETSRISRTQGTDIARQLSARRIIANELDTPMQRVFKLFDEAGVNPEVYTKRARDVDFNDPKAVIKYYRDLVPAKAGEWLDAIRYNSMLSSPKTQIVNAGGNLLNTSVVAPIEKTLGGAVDLFASKVTGKDQTKFMGEGPAYVKGYVQNSQKAVDSLINVMTGKNSVTNLDLRSGPLATGGVRGKIDSVLGFPTKLMEGFDQFFMALTEGGEQGALNYAKGKGAKFKGDINTMANENAKYRLFRQVLGDKSQGHLLGAMDYIPKTINAARNSKNPVTRTVAKFTFPFISTPTNIAKQGVEYSPFGFGTIPGAKNKTEQFTKALMGTIASAGAASLLGSGRLSWAEPIDPDERAAYRAAGQQPYSVKVGDKWISYTNLPPVVSFNLALIAALDDTAKNAKTGDDTIDKVMKSVSKIGNFFADKSYFKQMGDMLASVKGDPEALSKTVSNVPQQMIPFRAFGGWLARMFDDTQRKVDYDQNFIDEQVQQLMMNIPGLSQKVNPRLDPNGKPIPSQHRFVNAVSLQNVSTEVKDNLVYLAEQKNGISLYGYLKGMDKKKANAFVEDLAERKPELYGDIKKYRAIDEQGLGLPEYDMVGSGIKDGTRAQKITTQLNQLSTKAEKNEYISKLYDLGIMTDDIYDQLVGLKEKGKLKAPTDSQPLEAQAPQPVEQMSFSKPMINSETAPITQSYGNYNPEVEIFSGGTNYGTDIGVGEDTELSLPQGVWEVVEADDSGEMNRGYGKSILVENRKTGERIRLSHLNQVLADKGELIRGGSTIGFSGSTGNSTGPHVDVEYYDKDGNIGDILRSSYAKDL